jgi:hypothetical protein
MSDPSLDGTAGFHLEYDGIKQPYRFARDESGTVLGWRKGLAPMLAPQFRQSEFSYEHIPPEIDVPIAFEDWSGGSGFEDDLQTAATRPTRYNFTRGVDLSYTLPCLAAERQDTSAVSAGPTFIADTSLGIFICAGRYLYEFATAGSATVTQRRDLGAGNAFTGPVVEFSETNDAVVLVAPTGASDDYVHSLDGITWANATADDTNFIAFTVRGQTSNSPQLWGVEANGSVRVTQAPRSGGTTWTNSTQLGIAGETTQSLIEINDKMYVFKIEGIFRYDGTTPEDIWTGGRQMKRSSNGADPFLWFVGSKCYVQYGDRLLEYNPLGDTGFRFVFPQRAPVEGQAAEPTNNPELNGTITAVAGDAYWLYIALKNETGNTYLLKWDGIDSHGWHTMVYLGANDCDTLLVVGPGTPHATNPVLLFGYGTALKYIILPRSGLNPWDDTATRFDTGASNKATGSYITVGARSFSKFLNGGRMDLRTASAAKTVTLAYETDVASETTLITADTVGQTTINTSTEVNFRRIRWVQTLLTASNTTTPCVEGWVLNATLNPPRRRIWQADVALGRAPGQRKGGGLLTRTGVRAEEHLFGASERRATLYDRDDRSYTVRVLDIAGAGTVPKYAGDEDVVTVTIAEIQEITASGAQTLIWDEGAWDEAEWG